METLNGEQQTQTQQFLLSFPNPTSKYHLYSFAKSSDRHKTQFYNGIQRVFFPLSVQCFGIESSKIDNVQLIEFESCWQFQLTPVSYTHLTLPTTRMV